MQPWVGRRWWHAAGLGSGFWGREGGRIKGRRAERTTRRDCAGTGMSWSSLAVRERVGKQERRSPASSIGLSVGRSGRVADSQTRRVGWMELRRGEGGGRVQAWQAPAEVDARREREPGGEAASHRATVCYCATDGVGPAGRIRPLLASRPTPPPPHHTTSVPPLALAVSRLGFQQVDGRGEGRLWKGPVQLSNCT